MWVHGRLRSGLEDTDVHAKEKISIHLKTGCLISIRRGGHISTLVRFHRNQGRGSYLHTETELVKIILVLTGCPICTFCRNSKPIQFTSNVEIIGFIAITEFCNLLNRP